MSDCREEHICHQMRSLPEQSPHNPDSINVYWEDGVWYYSIKRMGIEMYAPISFCPYCGIHFRKDNYSKFIQECSNQNKKVIP